MDRELLSTSVRRNTIRKSCSSAGVISLSRLLKGREIFRRIGGTNDVTGKTNDATCHDRCVDGCFCVISHCHTKEHLLCIYDISPDFNVYASIGVEEVAIHGIRPHINP